MANSENEIKATLRQFISNNFLLGKGAGEIKDSDSFLETGVVDSTGVLEIVEFLQDTWQIQVGDDEILPENIDSLNHLVAFVSRKLPKQ